MTGLPRIQGKVGQATEPKEVEGKWFFEMWASFIGEGAKESLGTWGPFDSEELAQERLKAFAQVACEEWEMKVLGKKSGKYVDMKTNETRTWEIKE